MAKKDPDYAAIADSIAAKVSTVSGNPPDLSEELAALRGDEPADEAPAEEE